MKKVVVYAKMIRKEDNKPLTNGGVRGIVTEDGNLIIPMFPERTLKPYLKIFYAIDTCGKLREDGYHHCTYFEPYTSEDGKERIAEYSINYKEIEA